MVDCFGLTLFDDGVRIVSASGAAPLGIADDDLGNSSDEQKAARIQREQDPPAALPSALRLGYYDPALDYQSGEARATVADKRGVEEQRELPAAVASSDAKALAQRMIARDWARRDKLSLRLPPRYLAMQPGAVVDLDLSPRRWCVEQCTIDGFVVVAQLRPSWAPSAAVAADAGRIVANSDVVAGDVTLALFDLPDVLGTGAVNPTLLLAASSPSPGWRSGAVNLLAGELSLQARLASRKTVLGKALNVLPAGDPFLINRGGALEIELIDHDQWLLSCDDAALIGGSNLAVLGSELLQFGSVEPLGQGRFRLGRLLRGRAGTEWAMGAHALGEPFALIDAAALRPVAFASSAIGAQVNASIRNLSGTTSTSVPLMINGEGLRPLSPVALQAEIEADGGLSLAWTRRSWAGFAWVDAIDAPLGEATEQYRVTIRGPQGAIEVVANAPELHVSAAQLAGLGTGAATIEVSQIGDAALSRPTVRISTI